MKLKLHKLYYINSIMDNSSKKIKIEYARAFLGSLSNKNLYDIYLRGKNGRNKE